MPIVDKFLISVKQFNPMGDRPFAKTSLSPFISMFSSVRERPFVSRSVVRSFIVFIPPVDMLVVIWLVMESKMAILL